MKEKKKEKKSFKENKQQKILYKFTFKNKEKKRNIK